MKEEYMIRVGIDSDIVEAIWSKPPLDGTKQYAREMVQESNYVSIQKTDDIAKKYQELEELKQLKERIEDKIKQYSRDGMCTTDSDEAILFLLQSILQDSNNKEVERNSQCANT